jgi:hypothetical protein
MMHPRQLATAAVAVAAAAISSLAQATPVTIWNDSVLTEFNGTNTFTSGGGTLIQTPSQVSWGATGGNVFTNTGNPDTNRSGITIADSDTLPGANDPSADPISGQVTTKALSIPGIGLGAWITHHNNPISGTFATLTTTQIDSTLTLTLTPNTPPTPGQQGPITLTFTVFFAETPNATPCVAPSPSGNPCNDIFALNPSSAFNQKREVTIPEPGTIALLGAALGAGGLFSRRRLVDAYLGPTFDFVGMRSVRARDFAEK